MVNKKLLLWAAAVLIPAARAQFLQQGPKLVGTGAGGSSLQGTSVAVSSDGNTMITGAAGDSAGLGAAWVYVRANGLWTQQGPKLVGTGGTLSAQGISIALSSDGNTAIVGGPGDGPGGNTGAAWVFTRANGAWTQQGPKLIGDGTSQGRSVAISGDGNTALVGGPGSVTVFTRANGVWTRQSALPMGSGAVGDPTFGWAIALSADGNTALVGGNSDNIGVGAAWIYTRTGSVWTQQGPKLTASDTSGGSDQGISVALSADGNTAIVGGEGDANFVGAAWIYTRVGGAWTQQGPKLVGAGAVGSAKGINANQGISVSLSGDGNTAIVGGHLDNQSIGAAWVFTRANGQWTQQGSKLVGTGWTGAPPFSAPEQGRSVALSGDGHTAIVGGPFDQPFGGVWAFVFAPMHFAVSAPPSVVAGTPFTFAVTALNPDNSIATAYTGTVHFSANDPLADLPPDSPLANGTGTFSATLKSGNFLSPVIAVSDTANPLLSGSSALIGVQPAATSRFAFSATPASVTSGAGFSFILTAFDRFGNFAPSNTARVRFTSTDAAAVLPPESFMPSGVATFGVVLNTAGTQTITVADTSNSGVTGTSDPIAVTGNSGTINLAQGKPASQISTFRNIPTAVASRAVDGITDGNFYNGSVTATDAQTNPWWQVDLGASANISAITIWNRTDCCADRLSDYWVFVSDTPFQLTDTPANLQNRAGTFASHQTTAPSPSTMIPVNTQGRYVRVQVPITVDRVLSIAEVQVFGTFVSAPIPNLAQGKPATQSSDFPGYSTDGAGAAVDGVTDGNFFNGSVTATNLESTPWWQVDLGSSATVNLVVIWNRTDCCASRLNDYWVFFSNTPFLPTDTPATLQNRAGTFASHQTTAPDSSGVITIGGTVGFTGRYVRVQLAGTGYLSLAEVQVLGNGGPPLADVALHKVATQSSTLADYATTGASAAVDGNTDGNFFHGSVTATNLESTPWWQVDLGTSTPLTSMTIWNRIDCCASRLNDYWVFISDTPFLASDTPAALMNRAGTFDSHQTTAPAPSVTIPLSTQGRYVRVQLAGTDYLSLAEVQVFGQ